MGNKRLITVMIVNDSDGMNQIWKMSIDKAPDMRCVAVAHDGETALSLAECYQPDVVLMDVMMPGIDGIETTRRLISRYPTMRILVNTVHPLSRDAAIKAGAIDFIVMPAKPEQVVAAIRRAVKHV